MKTIFIDGGARVGESLDIYIQKDSKFLGCDIHLFECNPTHQPELHQLQYKFTDYNIHVHDIALWNLTGEQEFYFSIDQWGDLGCTLNKDKRERLDLNNPIKVKTIKLSDFLTQFNESDYIIVKLDIEGAEWEVITDLLHSGRLSMINELYVEWHDVFFNRNFEQLRTELKQYTNLIYDTWNY
jgi:FkbM family methyltransferase